MIRFSFMIREIINQTHTDAQVTRVYFNRINEKSFFLLSIFGYLKRLVSVDCEYQHKNQFKLSD